MNILGYTFLTHDTSASLCQDGHLLAAVEEERFTRDQKHTLRFPSEAIRFCLNRGSLSLRDLDYVAFPFSSREYLHALHKGFLFKTATQPAWWSYYCRLARMNLSWYRAKNHFFYAYAYPPSQMHFKLVNVPHHLAHAASAFFPSGWDEAAFLTIDGIGETATAMWGTAKGLDLLPMGRAIFPDSVGYVYTALTQYLGFVINSDEYKVMGLASFGDPSVYRERFAQVLHPLSDGRFRVGSEYFDLRFPGNRASWVSQRFIDSFGPPRTPESEITQAHKDLAASLQEATEEVMVALAKRVKCETGQHRLVFAGGCALNCVANYRILQEAGFDDIWIQPASYDAGTSLGAALFVEHCILRRPRNGGFQHAYLGPAYSENDIKRTLEEAKVDYFRPESITEHTATLLREGLIVGWFQGEMEFGPRALGNRSILADPTRPDMQDIVNRDVKHREDFRPFAPSCLAEAARDYFELSVPSPYMLLVAPVCSGKRGCIPAVTHIDGTARVHTVTRQSNPLYYDLISAFGRRSGVPVVLNTSFNVRGEPIVLTPRDALRCFYSTGIDALVIGPYVVRKPLRIHGRETQAAS